MIASTPSRQVLEETPARVLTFLRAVGTRLDVRTLLFAHGYSQAPTLLVSPPAKIFISPDKPPAAPDKQLSARLVERPVHPPDPEFKRRSEGIRRDQKILCWFDAFGTHRWAPPGARVATANLLCV